MKATLEIDFDSPELARKAALVVGAEADKRSSLSSRVDKSVLVLHITASGFAALRARVTSALRDIRVFLDAAAVVNSHGVKRIPKK